LQTSTAIKDERDVKVGESHLRRGEEKATFSPNEHTVFPGHFLRCHSRFLGRGNHIIFRGEHLDEEYERILGGAVLVGGPPANLHRWPDFVHQRGMEGARHRLRHDGELSRLTSCQVPHRRRPSRFAQFAALELGWAFSPLARRQHENRHQRSFRKSFLRHDVGTLTLNGQASFADFGQSRFGSVQIGGSKQIQLNLSNGWFGANELMIAGVQDRVSSVGRVESSFGANVDRFVGLLQFIRRRF